MNKDELLKYMIKARDTKRKYRRKLVNKIRQLNEILGEKEDKKVKFGLIRKNLNTEMYALMKMLEEYICNKM
jgi:hypothetical protein